MQKANELLSVVQAAKEKGVSASAIYLAISEGRLTAYRTRPVLIFRRDLEAWKATGRRPEKTGETA